MLVYLITFILTAFIFSTVGKGFVFYFDKNNNYGFFEVFFMGLCVVGTMLNFWSIFLPTDFYSLLFLIILSLTLLFFNLKIYIVSFKNNFNFVKSDKFFCCLLIIITLIILQTSLITPRLFDSYLYHIGAIQWNERYSVVPGLANFHDRFGFNSSMFVLSSAFTFSSILKQTIFIISPLVTLIFFVWLLKQAYFRKGVNGIFSLLFLYFFFQQYMLDISSPSSDLLPNVIVAFLILKLLFDFESIHKQPFFFVILPLFCITLKLSTAPILLISLIAIYQTNKKNLMTSFKFITFSTFFILPWLIRNVIISGYILYPMENLDLFNFDWEVPKLKVIETRNWVYSWARIPFTDSSIVMKQSFKDWFNIWWEIASIKNRRFLVLALLSPLFILVKILLNPKQKKSLYILPLTIYYLSLLFWLFTAPDIRFSFSVILILSLLPLLIFKIYLFQIKKSFYNRFFAISICFILLNIFSKSFKLFEEDYNYQNLSTYAFKPINVSTFKTKTNAKFIKGIYKTTNNKSIELYGPSEENFVRCFDKFPCTAYLNESFTLRGENLQDGFKAK